jgi:hypothetical protein
MDIQESSEKDILRRAPAQYNPIIPHPSDNGPFFGKASSLRMRKLISQPIKDSC